MTADGGGSRDKYPFLGQLLVLIVVVMAIVGVIALATGFRSSCNPIGGSPKCRPTGGWESRP